MEKKKFIIDEKMIAEATDYIPLSMKKAIATAVAEECLVAVDKTTEDIATETKLPIPQLYREECGAKHLYLMYYFLTEYLHIELKDDFGEEDYNYYASSHIFNQLERFKSGDKEIKDKVFDILYDFKELKKMLDTEIFNLKEGRNNGLDRVQAYLDLFADPESIKKLSAELQKIIGEVETKQAELKQKRATESNITTEKKD